MCAFPISIRPCELWLIVFWASRRYLAKAAYEIVVHEETLGQRSQVRIGEAKECAAQPVQELAHILLGVRQKIGQINLLSLGALDVVENHLQRALEQLDLAPNEQKIPNL